MSLNFAGIRKGSQACVQLLNDPHKGFEEIDCYLLVYARVSRVPFIWIAIHTGLKHFQSQC